ncbi:MAG: glycoside hydrolase family 15 protein [Thermoleophilia bacterium]
MRRDGYAPIESYAALGDGVRVALVARDLSIDWLGFPTMADAPLFGRLLDAGRGGACRLDVVGAHEVERAYLPGTNVLATVVHADGGTLRVVDALTTSDGGPLAWLELVRRVECLRGRVELRWSIEPRLAGGRTRVEVHGCGVPVVASEGDALAVLAWDLGQPVAGQDGIEGAATLAQGQVGHLALVGTRDAPLPLPRRDELERRLESTAAAWRRWSGGVAYDGPWRDQVVRAALVLRLLTYAPTGAILAAATTSLPERIGGERNWDYRFAWVRDSCFALDALIRLGSRELVQQSFGFLLRASRAAQPELPVCFAVDGTSPRSERTLDVEGYRGSRPVRIGNAAAGQRQLECYGDLFETAWLYVLHGNAFDPAGGRHLAEVADWVAANWHRRDAGIWEARRTRSHHTLSKLGCWHALTRATSLAERGELPRGGPSRWLVEAARVRAFVDERCWSEARGAYVGAADDPHALDAGVLRAAPWGAFDGRPERLAGTIAALRGELGVGPLLYRTSGLAGEEGAFLACSFWLASALARLGRVDEGAEVVEGALAHASDVGLLAEQVDPATGAQLGNVPQALSHLALVNAAFALASPATRDRRAGASRRRIREAGEGRGERPEG